MRLVSGCIVVTFLSAFLMSGLVVADVSGVEDYKHFFHVPQFYKGGGLRFWVRNGILGGGNIKSINGYGGGIGGDIGDWGDVGGGGLGTGARGGLSAGFCVGPSAGGGIGVAVGPEFRESNVD